MFNSANFHSTMLIRTVNNRIQKLPHKQIISKAAGPVFIFALMVFDMLSDGNIYTDSSRVIYVILIYLSALIGGLISGAAGIFLITLHVIFNPCTNSLYTDCSELRRITQPIDFLIFCFIAIAAGYSQRYLIENVKKLKDSESYIRELYQNVNDAIFLHEFNDSFTKTVFLEVNNRACTMLGYSREELLAMTPETITDNKTLKPYNMQQLTTSGRLTFEAYFISKGGSKIPVELSSHIFTRQGKQFILSVARDITVRKNADLQLRKSEERYRQLVELSPDAIFLHSHGKFTYANTAGLKLIGASSLDDIMGKKISDIIHDDSKSIVMERIARMYAGKGSEPLAEETFLRLDGTPVDVEVTAAPLSNYPNSPVVSIVRDITERKRSEELKKSFEEKNRLLFETVEMDKLKTEFFTNISHELRTPLNVILSTTQLSKKYITAGMSENDMDKLNKHTEIVRQNCYRLLRLVNNLIDITKIDAGYFDLHLQNLNIINIIEDITLSVAHYVESKGILLEFDTDTEEKIIACDPDKIERIILNLLSNAVKFTAPGGIIKINVYDRESSILIKVSDTGIGIPLEKQHMIFERFRQVDQSLTRNHEGSGIGLSLVKSLVELHGGSISLESEYGKGSSFIFEIPVTIACNDNEVFNNVSRPQQNYIEKINVEFSDIYNY